MKLLQSLLIHHYDSLLTSFRLDPTILSGPRIGTWHPCFSRSPRSCGKCQGSMGPTRLEHALYHAVLVLNHWSLVFVDHVCVNSMWLCRQLSQRPYCHIACPLAAPSNPTGPFVPCIQGKLAVDPPFWKSLLRLVTTPRNYMQDYGTVKDPLYISAVPFSLMGICLWTSTPRHGLILHFTSLVLIDRHASLR